GTAGPMCSLPLLLKYRRRRVLTNTRRAMSASSCDTYETPRAMLEERHVEQSALLKQLHIDRSDTGAPRRARWFVLVGCALLALAGGLLWFSLTRLDLPMVRLAVARSASQASGTGSVLDASGYVTARRQATVSAKITGKVAEVLIEEGMRV